MITWLIPDRLRSSHHPTAHARTNQCIQVTHKVYRYGLIAKQQKTCSFFLASHLNTLLLCWMCLVLLLLGFSEAHPVAFAIKHGVVLANKDVSQDPQRPGRGGDVQTHEAAQTDGLSGLRHLQD